MGIEEISRELAKKFGEEYITRISQNHSEIKELVTDSRNYFNSSQSLFFAIKTRGGNDGHKFMASLYENGVRNFVCQYIPEDFPKTHEANLLIVPDTIKALSYIGSLHRGNAREIVAITGSRGKTTVKELIFQLMEPLKEISRSPRSYNSKIGVPLSLWQIPEHTDIAIIEAGISRKGEMPPLSATISPDTVIITNVGEAHAAGFGSLQEKTEEKCLLASGSSVQTVIYPMDNPLISQTLNGITEGKNLIGWSSKNPATDVYIRENGDGISYTWKNVNYSLPVKIEQPYDLENFAGALTFMLKEEISPETIQERVKNLQKINTRMNVSEGINGCTVILDSYTSDISSLQPAIDFAKRRKMPWQSFTLIISDPHHEVSSLKDTYKEISNIAERNGVNKLIGIGKNFIEHSNLIIGNTEFFSDTKTFLKRMSLSDFSNEMILLKGSGEYGFEKIFEQLEARKHETVLEVNLDALLRNYNYFRSHVPSTTGVIAMVKASGYGAGSYEIAKTLQDAGASYLAVAALDEGVDLRRNGITMPIMIMNPRATDYKALFDNRLEPVIYSSGMLDTFLHEVEKFGKEENRIHLKLDTGMHRMGFTSEQIPALCEKLHNNSKIKVATIFSHLATADCLDLNDYTHRQLRLFNEMSERITDSLSYPVKRHILNSAGILRFPEYHYDYVRLGIGLYGANTLPPEIEQPLSVVSTLRSVIICIREVVEGEAVGYSRKGEIKTKSRIATVPIGYADGMNRKFGNGGAKVFVNGKYAPTIGNICMDAMMIDVTGIDCDEGDSVEIFGENVKLQLLADTLDTIPYEVLTSVSPRVKRVYYRE